MLPPEAQDRAWLQEALELAKQGAYGTPPNPRVGALLLRKGEIVGRGFHRQAGGPHAEIMALASAGERARGATLYVTLEPCCHHGRTPPCTEAIIAAGVERVVVAMEDPNPLVAGQGIQRLQEAGIQVSLLPLGPELRFLNRGFLQRMRLGRPWIQVKQASSLDGRTALASGESQWLTGTAAREDVQEERAKASAILVGVGTILADDPRLAPRLVHPLVRYPVKIVLDGHARTPTHAALLQSPGETWIIHTPAADPRQIHNLEAAGARLLVLPPSEAGVGVDWGALMGLLAQAEMNEILVEAGGRLASSLLNAHLVDEYLLYLAPLFLGKDARASAEPGPYACLSDIPRWQLWESRSLGPDVKLRYFQEELR